MALICHVLETYGFLPLETPSVEFASTLLGKYGEEEKLIYQFEDKGGRKLALRYDLTVPLARFVANNLELLKPTFSRYQIGQVFRGEKPQKGRYRELTQFDFDTIGSFDPKEDAKVVAAALVSVKKLGLSNSKMMINDRANFSELRTDEVRLIDKIHKIGRDKTPKKLLDIVDNLKPTVNLQTVFKYLTNEYGLKENEDFVFDPSLARGLDYYTGLIMELKPNGMPNELSVGGGGRYDDLIGIFANRKIPAVGFSFGLDRLVEFFKA